MSAGGAPSSLKGKEKPSLQRQSRRASSFFEIDFEDLRTKSASELWRGIVENRAASASGGKNAIRGRLYHIFL